MKTKFCFLPAIILVASVLSCTTLKRYDSIQPSGRDNTLAGIDLFGFKLSKAKPANGNKTLWDLSADAQSQFIKILNSRYSDNDKFIEALNFEYLKESENQMADDYVTKDLRMIFSVSKLRGFGGKNMSSMSELSPADRIEYLKITLRIPENSGVRFTGWNKYTTEYGSIDIADVSFSRSLDIDASVLFSTDKKDSGRELSAGGKSSSSRREDQVLKYRYILLNGRISNKEIEMEEEGTRETDLTGNITADVSLEFESFPERLCEFTGLRDSTLRFSEPDRVVIKLSDAVVPRIESIMDTLYADLKMEYVFRNVLKGQKTFPEWDDRIKYYTGSVSKKIPLFAASDYVPEFYCIGCNKDSDVVNIIKMKSPGNKDYSLLFRTHAEAAAFYEWLFSYLSLAENRGKTVTIGGYTLKFSDDDLTGRMFGKYPELRVMPYYR